METKSIIFDLFGTLIYTSRKVNPYLNLFNSLGLTKDEKSYWINRVLTKNYGYLQEIANEINKNINTSEFEKQVQEEIQSTHLFDDTIQVLDRLSSKYNLYLLSNISTPYKECLYNLEIDRYFKKVFFSCDIGYRKPDPNSFKSVIDYSGLHPNQLIMVGDSQISDCNGALNCGIMTIKKDKSLLRIEQDLTK